ncbi:OLC1v1024069C1 [Oldenlandia corymbosa var. corymbosa]|uniref:OLC1v1024069C1 n=1 Tax=Oldenlandia corymbosa var. corymbosa TaxID=529605 RepID=A0AAV1C1P0_OLDCO|nr:OLC1v1024069C1 [Oldenlandia corymbosa var. corymbosa]
MNSSPLRSSKFSIPTIYPCRVQRGREPAGKRKKAVEEDVSYDSLDDSMSVLIVRVRIEYVLFLIWRQMKGNPMSDISESSNNKYGVSRTVWTEGDVKLFVDLLLEYKRKGEMKENNFGKSWVQITKDFNAKLEYRQTLEQLSQKFHRFRIDWNAFKDLQEKHTGLGWDHQKGTVTASEERWKELIKTNKNHKKFQQKDLNLTGTDGRTFVISERF